MNITSILTLIVFFAVGYFIQPKMLPALQERGYGVIKSSAESEPVASDPDAEEVVDPTDVSDVSDVSDVAVENTENVESVVPSHDDGDDIENSDTNNPFASNPFETDPVFAEETDVEEKTVILESVKPMDEAKVIAAMKDAVSKGSVKSISSDQVTDWKMGEAIELEGVGYNVGVVEYVEDTIFGEQASKVKALFENGTLKKWVWYSTHRPLE